MNFFLNILSIFLLMSAGFFLRRRGLVDDVFTRRLSVILVNVFYPCLILHAILSKFTLASISENWLLPLAVFIIHIVGWLAGAGSRRLWQGGGLATKRTFHFVCSVNNYTFLPIMIALPLWGETAVALIAFGALGAEIFIWTLGVRTLSGKPDLRQLLSNPMLALLSAGVFLLLRQCFSFDALPAFFHDAGNTLLSTLKTAGGATIPVSAVICGARIASVKFRDCLTVPVWTFSALRLLVIPAACVAIIWFLPLPELARNVVFLIAIQPAAMASVSLSEVYGGDPAFAATAVFLTHLLCLATIPLWMKFLAA